MTHPINPNPVPLAQKLWTVKQIHNGYAIVEGESDEIFRCLHKMGLDNVVRRHNTSLALPEQEERETPAEAYGRGVTAGKLEALKYTTEERERYGRWVAQSETPVTSKAEDGQTQKSLSVVLDEIEHRVTRVIVFGRANVTGDAVSVDVFVDDCRSDIPALVKALRESRIWFLREVGPDSYEHKAYDTKITTLLTSPADRKMFMNNPESQSQESVETQNTRYREELERLREVSETIRAHGFSFSADVIDEVCKVFSTAETARPATKL